MTRWPTVIAMYVCLALAYCWPLFLAFNTALPNDTGDPGLLSYLIWWNAQAVPFTEKWWNVPMFYPQAGVMAFSESFLGVAPFTAPLIWSGIGAVATHNVLFIASIATAAIAAHALARHLTGRHDVALIAGLAFGFSPYRASQMPHVHLLVTCWMAIGLLALHRYVERRRPIDLVWLAIAWLLNGLTSGYYLVYFAVLAGLWMLWFLRDRRAWISVSAALALASGPILLLLAGYTRIQRGLGFARSREEIETFSADLSAFLVSSFHTWLPHHWSLEARPEGELYPGIAIVVLTVVGAVISWRRLPRLAAVGVRRWLFFTGLAVSALAVVSAVSGGTRLDLGFLEISFTRPHRIVTVAFWLLVAAALCDRRIWAAWQRRSAFAFYGFAALAMAVLSLGPVGHAFGVRFLNQAPYSWLMEFPGGDSLRVPARFAMLSFLCMGVTAAMSLARLMGTRTRPGLVVLCAMLVLADGWVPNMHVAMTRENVNLPGLENGTVVLELPMRDLYSDTAAMLRATEHRRPLLNGFSGYGPPHYYTMMEGLRGGDPSVFETLREMAPLAVLVNKDDDPEGTHAKYVGEESGGMLMYRTPVGSVFRFPKKAPPERLPGARAIEIVGARANVNNEVIWALRDGSLESQWQTLGPQEAGNEFTVLLGSETNVERIEMDLGAAVVNYPRSLRIDALAPDGSRSTLWQGGTAGPAVAALIADRVRAPLTVDLPAGSRASALVFTLTTSDPVFFWTVAELRIFGR